MVYRNAVGTFGSLINDERRLTKRQVSNKSLSSDSCLLFFVSAFSVSGLGICENREAQNQPCDE